MKKYRKIISLLIFASLFLFALNASAASVNRYFIKSNNGFWKNTFNARHEFDNGFTADLTDWQLRIAKLFNVEFKPVAQLEILPDEEEIEVIEEDSFDQTPWGIEFLYNDPEIIETYGGEDVIIAVLDTGVDVKHPDLENRIEECRDFTHSRSAMVEGKCEDNNGHGTHVAGIALADGGSDGLGIYGVAPGASLWAYKVCNESGSCWADDIAAAIMTVADNGEGAKIINLSLGSDIEVGLVSDAVNYAKEKGVLIVAASGNDGPDDGSIDYPGALEYVISVGAFDIEGSITEWSSRGSNSDSKSYLNEKGDIEFVSPGMGIESTWKDGGYAMLSGTSMATPFIAGLAARMWDTDAATTRSLLHTLAQDLWDSENDGNDSGWGVPIIPIEL